LITSALPYANGALHFGHIAGAYLPGDAYARFERLQKNDVMYICGSDEYGIAITLAAELAKQTPQQRVDQYHEVIKGFFKTLNMSFDHYSRTTSPLHKKPVQEFFLDLLNNGYIEEKETEQLYSESEKRFLADRYVVGTCPKCGFTEARGDECTRCGSSFEATELKNPRSKLTGSPLILKSTKHWFLRLDLFKDKLTAWLGKKNWKPNVVNFIKGYIQDLRPRAITRDMEWGVPLPLPNTQGKVLYVWFDAPIGYISATMEGFPDRWKDYWLDPATKLVNFVGKDNIPFHAAIFPAMEMGQNTPYKIVDELPANEFYNLEGRQFSKSDNWMIDLDRFFSRYTADQIRYTIAANAPETSDSEFTWKDFQTRCNSELLGKLGNLVNRVLTFAHSKTDGKVPQEPDDLEVLDQAKKIVKAIEESYSQFRLRQASALLMELAALGNVYFDSRKPWADAKNPETLNRMRSTVRTCLDLIKLVALSAYPIIPDTSDKIWSFLGFKESIQDLGWKNIVDTAIPSGQTLNQPVVLFKKIEDAEINEEIEKLKAMATPSTPAVEVTHAPLKGAIDIDQFDLIDLRVGQILSAEPVPKSKKLLKLQVDLGFEKRQIVSGISLHYKPEELVGKKVVIVANLKPATLMGIESQGMVLAASHASELKVIETDLPPGSIVK
jgi:methionyl-tRNA synthetase